MQGRCTCGAVRYELSSGPMFVHCCHCRWCQRETGSAFAINALIESDRVVLLQGAPESILTPSNSGKGQNIARCPSCRVALWSNYGGSADIIRFVRVGTLEEPDLCPPDRRCRSSLGSYCPRMLGRFPNTTRAAKCGPKHLSRVAARSLVDDTIRSSAPIAEPHSRT